MSLNQPPPPSTDDQLRAALHPAMRELGLHPLDQFVNERTQSKPFNLRRGVERPPTDGIELLALTRDSAGVLRWQSGASPFSLGLSPRRASRATLPAGRVIQQYAYQQIPGNQVVTVLEKLDDWLTKPRGLRRWNPDTQALEPFDGAAAAGKRVLLFIHGTFSHCDNVLGGIRRAPGKAGHEMLAHAARHYDFVLTFDHPTISVSPIMNAFDLAGFLRPPPRELHIIAHSRGGLVTRWFLEAFLSDALRQSARAVLVGSTIGGTSLAAPHRIKSAMDYFANVGEALGTVAQLGAANPFLAASGVLMQVFSSVTNFAAKTPVFDAAIALVPGLHAQARVGNNQELTRLRANTGANDLAGIKYYSVSVDFQPRDPGWNFLQYFSKPMQRIANWGADLIFEGPNDLVADVATMTDLADKVSITDRKELGLSETIHHTNYFEQAATLKFIRESLEF